MMQKNSDEEELAMRHVLRDLQPCKQPSYNLTGVNFRSNFRVNFAYDRVLIVYNIDPEIRIGELKFCSIQLFSRNSKVYLFDEE